MSSLFKSRIKYTPYLSKVAKASDCIPFFKNGQVLGWSGFGAAGAPKKIPDVLSDYVEANNLQGELRFSLLCGASTGPMELRWAKNKMLSKRSPYQSGKIIADGVNSGEIEFFDKHLSSWIQDIGYGFYSLDKPPSEPSIDIAIIECSGISEDGSLIMGPAIGAVPELTSVASKIILEVNTSNIWPFYQGIHDCVPPVFPPYRKPISISKTTDRIGTPTIQIDPSKVIAVVESDEMDSVVDPDPIDDVCGGIASHLIEFFQHEVKYGRLPQNLLPLQSGVGNIANAVIEGLAHGPFSDLYVWSEVLQDSFIDFMESGKVVYASSTALVFSRAAFGKLYSNWEDYKKMLILRPQSVTNLPEIIRRLGVIAMNSSVEVDIYGHANSSHVSGSKLVNGIGGSNDFLRSGKLGIMHSPSSRPTKTDPFGISCIVPMCSHIDHTEHDLDIMVTEQGLADLRGCSPRNRALKIIENCAHPVYKPLLLEYFKRAEFECKKSKSLNEPQMLDKVFKMHLNLRENGTMRIDSWK